MRWPLGRASARDSAEALAAAEDARERGRRTGEIVRQARVARGLTLSDIERDLKINRTYIEALEGARFETLPAPVYARGFMRSYARYLGLDPEEAARAIPRDLPRPAGLEPSPGLRRSPPMTLPSIALTPPMLIAGIALVVVLVLAGLFVPRFMSGESGRPLSAPAGSTAATSSIDAPNVVGLPAEQAKSTLERAGLTTLIFPSENAAPTGQVFRQSPPVGAALQRGDQVTLFVSQGPGTPSPAPTPSRTPTPSATPAR